MVVAEALDFPGAATQGFDLADARLMIASALKVCRASDSQCDPPDAGCTNHARGGGSIHSNCGVVPRPAGAGLSEPSPLTVAAAASLGNDHQVFELQKVFELGSLFGT
jgi:hypothetical protein